VHRLISAAVEQGAQVLPGGEPAPGPGFFYPPTVLTEVPADAAPLHEEPFGPVAPISGFDDLDAALEMANALPYGLAGYGFTESTATAERLIAGLEAGILSINHCGGSVPQARPAGSRTAATAGKAATRA
jgi:succinate-semialdehyde dehydrogenase / glutarate-semialdehyde dehydrogenase